MSELATDSHPVMSFLDNFKSLIEHSSDPTLMKIAARYGSHINYDEAFANVSRGDIVMGESKNFLDYKVREKFTNK